MRRPILIFAALFFAFQLGKAQFSIQKVIVEEFTGAWCGYCPEGADILDQILTNNQNAIGVSIHNGDAMTFPDGDAVAAFYNDGYPSAVVNRETGGLSRNVWASNVNSATQGAGNVTVSFDSLDWNPATREVYVRIKAQFTGPDNGDIRFNCFITEDHVTGSGSGYDQANYFNGTPGHNYYQAGNPIIGFDHRHVLRAMLGGPWGTAGIIPNTVVAFSTVETHSYTYTLPPQYDENNIHLVALVQKFEGNGQTERPILNGEEMPLITATAVEDGINGAPFMEIFPNPASQRATIAFSLEESSNLKMEVLDAMGRQVLTLASGYMVNGAHTLYWDGRDATGQPVANGVYMIRLATERGQSTTKRLMLLR